MATEIQQYSGLYGFDYIEQDKRRAMDGERKTPQIKMLWQQSHEIINLAARGFKNVEIAEIMHCTPETVSNTLNSDLGKHKLAELRRGRDEEVKKDVEKIRVLTNKAMEIYHRILDDDSGECNLMDKKKVADTIMTEFSGLREPLKVQSQSTHTVLTVDDITEIKRRARESGMIVESKATLISDGEVENDSLD